MYGVETYDFLRQLSDDVAKSCQDTTRNCESDIGVRLKKPSINPGEGDAGHDTVKKSSNACCGTGSIHSWGQAGQG